MPRTEECQNKLYNNILSNMKPDSIQATHADIAAQVNERPDWVNPFVGQNIPFRLENEGLFSGNLIHDRIRLLLCFVTDAEQDLILLKYTIGVHYPVLFGQKINSN